MKCRICRAESRQAVYHGKVRLGRFGNLSKEKYQLFRCSNCGTIELPRIIEDIERYYESDEYRSDVNQISDAKYYYQVHDAEQIRHFQMVGTDKLRGKIIADVGCGAGSFLDFASGLAKTIIAVEPNKTFQAELQQKKYQVFDYVDDVLIRYQEKVDLVTCFSTIEHISDPLSFLTGIRKLVASDGEVIISTPNSDDALLSLLPDTYPAFFYRKVHLWYFNKKSLLQLAHQAGFGQVDVFPFQRFGLSNCLNWLRDKAPKGDNKLPFVSDTMENVWRNELERQMVSDYLFMKLKI